MRSASIERNTKETQIHGNLRSTARHVQDLNRHSLFRSHAGTVRQTRRIRSQDQATGDLDVDQHHTVEDVGIALGQVVREGAGRREGSIAPATSSCRWMKRWRWSRWIWADVRRWCIRTREGGLVGDLQTELLEDFFDGFINHAGANVHVKVLYGRSNHHKIEAVFKCFARAMRYACSTDKRLKDQLPSTKGLLMIRIFDYGAGNLALGAEHARSYRRGIHPRSRAAEYAEAAR